MALTIGLVSSTTTSSTPDSIPPSSASGVGVAPAGLTLVRLAWLRIPRDDLSGHTLLTPCEPCSGAIWWPGVPVLDHASRAVLADGSRGTVVVGPELEDEAAVPHRDFWRPGH
jgi:hypothetical protein